MNDRERLTVAFFYCRNIPESGETERQALEKEYGPSIRLFPIPCSGRLDPVHLLSALEKFADAAYLIACPEGACRYFEGNRRAGKRVERTKEMIAMIGLEPERLGMVINTKKRPKGLGVITAEILERVKSLAPSPVLKNSRVEEEKPL
ncbi:MAG: hydrogenase iron-sulfur subunit [Deltaproteobacteria bacterium]|nr:hydrogenase iron-sulfur subunit [Deltaproteobacteria bacterium]